MAQSIGKSASASAPTAGTAVATTATCPGGWYDVQVVTQQTGTVDTNPANMKLRVGTTDVCELLSTAAVATQRFRVNVPAAGATLNVVAIGNAGASSVYNASISATRIPSANG